MKVFERQGITLHWREDGDPSGIPVVFANSLGTDLRVWDPILPYLPAGLRIIRYDKRGHGLSGGEDVTFGMPDLVSDAAALIENVARGPVIFVGLSIGGMIGQTLAAERSDLISALVLSNTARTMGSPEMWKARIDGIERDGISAHADQILERWFGAAFRARPESSLWRCMLVRTTKSGYTSCCKAIAATDLTAVGDAISQPALCVAGDEDRACPHEDVSATAAAMSRSECAVLPGVGHLPSVEAPAAFAKVLNDFLERHAHG